MGVVSKVYLILYNLILTLGWTYVLFLAWEKRNDHTKMWAHVQWAVKIFQTAALMEVVHAATGIEKSNVFLTFFQVLSRVFVVWCVLEVSPPSTTCVGVPLVMIAWDITEIIRYGYYFLNLIGMQQVLVWFRYTLFIILYPIGITGELICMYYSLEYIRNKNLFTFSMPNAFNFTFDYQYAMVIAMLSYIPIFPQLYCHMFAQRRKILGGGSKAKAH